MSGCTCAYGAATHHETRHAWRPNTHTLTRTHKTHHQIIHTFRLHYPPSKTRTPNGWKPTLNRSHDHAPQHLGQQPTEVCMTEKRILVVWEKTLTSMIRKEKTHFQALLQISDTSVRDDDQKFNLIELIKQTHL